MGYDAYDQTNKIVKKTSDGYWGGSMGKHGFEADVPSRGNEGLEAENPYTPGALLKRAAEMAVNTVVDVNLSEENLGPQPA